MAEFNREAHRIPGVKDVVTASGFSIISGFGENVGLGIAVLEDWDRRKRPEQQIDAVRQELMRRCAANIPEATVSAFQPPAIMGLGATGGISCVLKTSGDRSTHELEEALNQFLAWLNNKKEMPQVSFAFSPFNARMPQIELVIDRQKAKRSVFR
jgi:multidrug efflux pump subunit AcrB